MAGAVPGAGEDVVFDLTGTVHGPPGPYTVSFAADHQNTRMAIDREDVTFALNGHTYELTSIEGADDTASIFLGQNAENARLQITGGTLQTQSGVAIIAGSSDSTAEVIVPGGATWNAGLIYVGTRGAGALRITSGGVVTTELAAISAGFDFTPGTDSNVTVDGSGSSWSIAGVLAFGGFSGGSGTLAISNGGSVSNGEAILGATPATTAAVDVTGAGSLWTVTGPLHVGYESFFGPGGTGSISIGTGAEIRVSDAVTVYEGGTVNLNGGKLQASGLLFVGSTFNFNAGTLEILSDLTATHEWVTKVFGAERRINTAQNLSVGGTMTLEANLVLDGGTLTVDTLANPAALDFRRGTLNLSELVSIGSGGIFGSTLNLNQDQHLTTTNIGRVESDGLLRLAGGTFAAGIGLGFGIDGELRLDGPTSEASGYFVQNNGLISGTGRVRASFQFTNSATGEIRAATGEQLRFGPDASVPHTNNGSINLLGGSIEFDSTLTNSASGIISGRGALIANAGLVNQGRMAFSGGFADAYGDVTNSAGARIIVAGGATATFHDDLVHNGIEVHTSTGSHTVLFGAVSGTGPFTGTGTVFMEGDLLPGNSTAIVSFDGDLVFGSLSTMHVELGGDIAGSQYDQVNVAGTASVAGSLDVALINGFNPTIGQQFTVLTANSIANDGLELGGPAANAFTLLVSSSSIILQAIATGLPGDYNQNGIVDAADYTVWRDTLGQMGAGLAADGNGNGEIDAGDYDVWILYFGETLGSGSAGASPSPAVVPEPANGVLLVGLFVSVLLGRRRRNPSH